MQRGRYGVTILLPNCHGKFISFLKKRVTIIVKVYKADLLV